MKKITATQNNGSVSFDPDGKWTEIQVTIPVYNLPSKALEYLQTNYENHPLTGALKITRATGEIKYEAEIPGKEVHFTQQGSFIKAKTTHNH